MQKCKLGKNKFVKHLYVSQIYVSKVPGAGLEPAQPLRPQDFKSCVSTNSTIRASLTQKKSEKRDSNPRPRPWQGRALPTELFSHSSAPDRACILLWYRTCLFRRCKYIPNFPFSKISKIKFSHPISALPAF